MTAFHLPQHSVLLLLSVLHVAQTFPKVSAEIGRTSRSDFKDRSLPTGVNEFPSPAN